MDEFKFDGVEQKKLVDAKRLADMLAPVVGLYGTAKLLLLTSDGPLEAMEVQANAAVGALESVGIMMTSGQKKVAKTVLSNMQMITMHMADIICDLRWEGKRIFKEDKP